eukprot:TRINITY_DN35639_c0_g1_i1.p1 TRINITY_DN35639_c0_g1~~TRINITY_DN35639_c0_g1_i1.p1  ORF type:complete len:268 (-),score=49.46 TRINITY_DN35639_c0_g1_i1:84-887(-)
MFAPAFDKELQSSNGGDVLAALGLRALAFLPAYLGGEGAPQHHLWRFGGEAVSELRLHHCNIPFEPQSTEVESMLREIWAAAFCGDSLGHDLRSESWMRLGFQSSDPRTDVRAGLFALEQLHYMAVMYPEKLRQLVRQAADLEYFFAISCFNLTHMLLVFFDLFDRAAVSPVQGAEQASVEQLGNFSSLCSSSPYSAVTVLNELFVALSERLHKTWKNMRASKDCNVMQHFHEALQSVHETHSVFWNQPHDDVADFCFLASPSSKCA